MLEQILRILDQEGVHHPSALASRLGVSRELIDQMLIFLIKTGKVHRLTSGSLVCSSYTCANCSAGKVCAQPTPSRSYKAKEANQAESTILRRDK